MDANESNVIEKLNNKAIIYGKKAEYYKGRARYLNWLSTGSSFSDSF